MAQVKLKSILLYDKRRVRPETIEAIRTARDGSLIGVMPDEMAHFQQLIFFEPEVQRVKEEKFQRVPAKRQNASDESSAS